MNKSEKNIYYLYIIFSFLFIAVTTNYLSLNDIIFIANQTDSLSYTAIAKNAPLLTGEDYFFYTFISGMFLWSMHPTYSVFKLFGVFRFYSY